MGLTRNKVIAYRNLKADDLDNDVGMSTLRGKTVMLT